MEMDAQHHPYSSGPGRTWETKAWICGRSLYCKKGVKQNDGDACVKQLQKGRSRNTGVIKGQWMVRKSWKGVWRFALDYYTNMDVICHSSQTSDY
jgi:hypothetical protein